VERLLSNARYEETVVIDQSDVGTTEQALSAFADPRLRYLRTPTRGVIAARTRHQRGHPRNRDVYGMTVPQPIVNRRPTPCASRHA
jgi:hypothetical protein